VWGCGGCRIHGTFQGTCLRNLSRKHSTEPSCGGERMDEWLKLVQWSVRHVRILQQLWQCSTHFRAILFYLRNRRERFSAGRLSSIRAAPGSSSLWPAICRCLHRFGENVRLGRRLGADSGGGRRHLPLPDRRSSVSRLLDWDSGRTVGGNTAASSADVSCSSRKRQCAHRA
jgi:hypothetical protein